MKRLFLPPALILCLASCSCEPPKPTPTPPYDVGLGDGSVIFWRGGLLVEPILKHTDSDITHAAIVLYQGKQPWVCEAVPPRVHKVLMNEYRERMQEKIREARQPMIWFIMEPIIRFTPDQLAAMKRHAESQLGRPYMLRGWWKGHEVRGIFCSQLVGDVLAKSHMLASGGIHESPGSLYEKLLLLYKETP